MLQLALKGSVTSPSQLQFERTDSFPSFTESALMRNRKKMSFQDLLIFINVSSHTSSIVCYSQSLENNFLVNIRPLQLSLMLSALTYTLSINSLN